MNKVVLNICTELGLLWLSDHWSPNCHGDVVNIFFPPLMIC